MSILVRQNISCAQTLRTTLGAMMSDNLGELHFKDFHSSTGVTETYPVGFNEWSLAGKAFVFSSVA